MTQQSSAEVQRAFVRAARILEAAARKTDAPEDKTRLLISAASLQTASRPGGRVITQSSGRFD